MQRRIFENWLLTALLAFVAPVLQAQNSTVLFTVTDINSTTITQKINTGTSALLTEFNKAYSENRTPSLNRITGLSRDARNAIISMWELSPFYCVEASIKEAGLRKSSGWQVRNIQIILKDLPKEEAKREIVINFDQSGSIDDVFFAIDYHHYQHIIWGGEITELRFREAILAFVESFRAAYDAKNIGFIEKVFSDYALIITGKVVKQEQRSDLRNYGISQEKIEYQVSTKKEYISRLSNVFKNNARIHVVFDDIEVVRHPKFDEIYGVTLKQGWNSTNYSDVGFLFLLIDFKDGVNMQIHVRTWQPEKLNGRQLDEDEVFSLGDFIIQQKSK